MAPPLFLQSFVPPTARGPGAYLFKLHCASLQCLRALQPSNGWLFPACSLTLRRGSSSGPPPHSGDSDPLPAPGRLAGVSLNHGCPVALLPAKHIPHGCGTVTSPPFVELIALSRPLFRWITSPRADRAFLLRSPHCYSFCWAERVCVCLARRYSPKERASHGRAGVDNVPRVKVPHLCSTLLQVPDKHQIP